MSHHPCTQGHGSRGSTRSGSSRWSPRTRRAGCTGRAGRRLHTQGTAIRSAEHPAKVPSAPNLARLYCEFFGGLSSWVLARDLYFRKGQSCGV